MKNLIYIIGVAAISAACTGGGMKYDASGVFEATEVVVSAKAQGEIVSLGIEEGDNVQKGQLLGTIDATQLSLKKNQLQSTRQAASSRKLDVTAQIASLTQQISNAQREKSRYQALLKDKAATQKQVDDITYQISVLEKQRAALQDQMNASNKSLDEQSASVSQQIAGVEQQISDANITAPITGTIMQKYAEAGEYAVPGKPVLKIANLQDIRLRAYITADQFNDIKVGQKVTVYADQGKDGRREYQGTISWIAGKAEFTPKTIQTRDERANLVYAVKISVKNDGYIKEGMYGEVVF